MENPRHKGTNEFRIASDLRRRIEAGEWAPGEKMPTYLDLAQQYELSSPVTLKNVANILRTWGLVVTRPRKGMYRRPPKPLRTVIPGAVVEYTEGDAVSDQVPAFSWIAEELGVDASTMVHRTRWVVKSGSEAWCITDLFSLDGAPVGHPDPYAAADRIRVTLPNETEAELLNMPPEVPVLLLLNKTGDYVVRRLIPGDRAEYRAA